MMHEREFAALNQSLDQVLVDLQVRILTEY